MKDVSNDPLPTLPPRAADSHKGNYGRLLLVGGSQGMAGSISLSGMAALRSGAGLVTIATPAVAQPTVASFSPAYMTVALPDDGEHLAPEAADELRRLAMAQRTDVVALGPGLGRSAAITQLVARLYREVTKPMVVDADGLNALAEVPEVLEAPGGPRVLTPHPGEYDRMTGQRLSGRTSTRAKAAVHLAAGDTGRRTVVLLKGAGSVVADAKRYSVNATGNPGMASGGTGDVLTGVVAGRASPPGTRRGWPHTCTAWQATWRRPRWAACRWWQPT